MLKRLFVRYFGASDLTIHHPACDFSELAMCNRIIVAGVVFFFYV